MNNRLLTDWILIFLIYAIYAGLIVVSTMFDLPTQLGVEVGNKGNGFLSDFQMWCFVSLGVSLFATIFWYVIGEWGPTPGASSSPILYWLLGLVLATVGGIVGIFYGPQPSSGIELLAAIYITSSILFYWVATMLFSPVNVKYVVPGSKLFRRW